MIKNHRNTKSCLPINIEKDSTTTSSEFSPLSPNQNLNRGLQPCLCDSIHSSYKTQQERIKTLEHLLKTLETENNHLKSINSPSPIFNEKEISIINSSKSSFFLSHLDLLETPSRLKSRRLYFSLPNRILFHSISIINL